MGSGASLTVDFASLNVLRLNLTNVGDPWPSSSDIPLYLWMGSNSTTSLPRTIPSRPRSHTTHITCFNVTREFGGPVELVTSLCLEGAQPKALSVTRLLGNFPHFQRLDTPKHLLAAQGTSATKQSYDSNLNSSRSMLPPFRPLSDPFQMASAAFPCVIWCLAV